MSDPVYAGMATLPKRWDHLQLVLAHILPAVDRLCVYVDEPGRELPDFLKYHPKVWARVRGDHRYGDTGKFLGLFEWGDRPAYWVILDDDLFYPPEYVGTMVKWVDHFERRALVAVGGAIAKSPCTKFYGDCRTHRYHYSQGVQVPLPINIPNTGICAFHSETVHPALDDFPVPNMTDVWLGKWCNERDIPQMVIPHRAAWFEHAPIDLSETIYETHKNDCQTQTDVINSREWTVVKA